MTVAPAHGITHRRVLGIALPILVANATVPVLGLVDIGVVGQLGDPVPIGAVAIGAGILTAVYWIFGFLRMGTTGMTSQALGADDRQEADALLSRAMIVGLGGGLLLIILQWPVFHGGFLVSPASSAVEDGAKAYMSVRIWSAPAAIALFGINGWLIAAERTRAVLALQVWMNGLNAVLDVTFVLGFGWGVGGVALATFLAEWGGLALGLWLCRDAIRRTSLDDWPRILSRARLFRMAAIHRDILLRSLFIESIFVSFLFFGARFGDVTLAANQMLLQFVHVTAYALDGFAIAAETLVGNATGARDRTRLRKGALLTSAWGAGVMAVFSAAAWAFGPWVIDLMTTADEVRRAAKALLPWMIAAPVLGIAAWMLDGIFIGATRTADMRNMTAVSAAIYFASVWILSGHGNDGIWMALLISLVARGVTLGVRYPALERAGG